MRRWQALLAPILLFQLTGSAVLGQTDDRALLERILLENIIPFWYPGTLDREFGGYRLNHALDGSDQGSGPKGIVTQARMVWFFSRLHRSAYGKPEHLEAARHGFEFLRDRLWDQEHGGFYWSVSADGAEALQPMKHLYGQSFGLYALAEYYRASGDPEARALAARMFSLLEDRAHDGRFGGYREFFNRDWSEPDDQPGYMGVPADIKIMNTHLHLMEAFATYHRVEPSPLVRERLLELIQILSNSVVRKTWGACTDRHFRDWTPVMGPAAEMASYGHDLENVWLLMDASESAGVGDGPLLDLYESLWDYSLRYGWDEDQGGFYYTGPLGQPAVNRAKSWWVQAEVLVSALRMYEKTGNSRYQEIFQKTLRWIVDHQIDWRNGEWFESIRADGAPSGVKAGIWKSAYHNGRAMLECLEILGGNRLTEALAMRQRTRRAGSNEGSGRRILLEHVAFNVPDPVAMADWYCRNLDMRIVRQGPAPAHARFVADSEGRRILELYHNPPDRVPDYRQIDPLNLHIAFVVEDVSKVRQLLLEAGAADGGEPQLTPAGDTVVFLRDPWGVPIQLVHRSQRMLP